MKLSAVLIAGATASLVAGSLVLSSSDSLVRLQQSTPGVQQVGHANLSGTFKAGQFQGGGAGIANVNADLLDGINSTAFGKVSAGNTWTGANTFASGANSFFGSGSGLTALNATNIWTGELSLTGSVASLLIYGDNASSAVGATSVRGFASNGTAGLTDGVSGETASLIGAGIIGTASHATGGNFGVYGKSLSADGTGVFGSATATNGVTFGGKFTSSSPQGYAGHFTGLGPYTLYAENNSSSSGSAAFFRTNSNNGSAVEARGTLVGLSGVASGTSGIGVIGEANSTSGAVFGGRFWNRGDGGSGVYGEATNLIGYATGGIFVGHSVNGTGVIGETTSETGNTFAGRFYNSSSSGTGVYAETFANTGATIAFKGVSSSTEGYVGYFSGVGPDALFVQNTGSGRGIRVESNSNTAIWATASDGFAAVDGRNGNPTGFGVLGYTYSGTGVNYGVFGQSASPVGWGVYSWGNFGASGTKSFRIDHPLDPENKYLLHYSTESPFPQNFYTGNVVTDGKGYAWVQLPDYFDDINTECKYQLTVVDDADTNGFVQVKVSKEIRANRFQIRTSVPNTKVSWRVDANRNDRYVRFAKPKDVVEKEGTERGSYQHPELYGLGPERGIIHRPEHDK